jgi:hypothetical protein
MIRLSKSVIRVRFIIESYAKDSVIEVPAGVVSTSQVVEERFG